MEEWKIIKTHPNYEVSSKGRIRRSDTKVLKCLSVNASGYHKVTLYPNPKTFVVHRLVAIEFIESPKDKPQVNHIDSNRLNNCVENLEWVTNKENMIHCAKANRSAKHDGPNNPTARFTEEEIVYIRTSNKQTLELANEFGVRPTSISAIRTGAKYKTSGGPIQEGQRVYSGDTHPTTKVTKIQKEFIATSDLDKEYLAKLFNIKLSTVNTIKRNHLKTFNDYPTGE